MGILDSPAAQFPNSSGTATVVARTLGPASPDAHIDGSAVVTGPIRRLGAR